MGKGFNIYTGVERTPVALAWMLRRRQRILGDIQAIERAVVAAPAKIAGLRKELEALETTIGMHEHPVDLAQIPPKRLRQAPKIKLPYGAIPKAVWKLLRENGNAPTKTSEFAYFVAREQGVQISKENLAILRRLVITQLNYLASRGKLEALHPRTTNQEGIWRLSSAGELEIPRAMRSLPVAEPPAGTS